MKTTRNLYFCVFYAILVFSWRIELAANSTLNTEPDSIQGKANLSGKQPKHSCEMHDWKSMVCTWTCEKHSQNLTWKVQYKKGNAGWKDCPLLNNSACSCTWPSSSFTTHFLYKVKITANKLYKFSFKVDASNKCLIRASPAQQVTVVPINSTSVKVTVNRPGLLSHSNLVFKVSVKSKFDEPAHINEFEEAKSEKFPPLVFIINGLIPAVNYTATVTSRVDRSHLWSTPSTSEQSARTFEDVPGRNADTRPSSYRDNICDLNTCRSITVYFKDIPEVFTHGNIINISASIIGDGEGNQRDDMKCEMRNRRKCWKEGLRNTNYTIVIQAITSKGRGPLIPTSVMKIPEKGEGSKIPDSFVGEIQNVTGNKFTVLFEWRQEQEADYVVIYDRYKTANEADGGMHWVTLDGKLNNAKLDYKDITQREFAVASEKSNQSAGMSKIFLRCLYDANGEIPIMPSITNIEDNRDKGSVRIKVAPQKCLDERRQRQITYFLVNISEVTSDGKAGPKGSVYSEPIAAHQDKDFVVKNLHARSDYSITLTAICRDGSHCGKREGYSLDAHPFPVWVIMIIVFIILLLGSAASFTIYWFYKVTSRSNQITIQRTPAQTIDLDKFRAAPNDDMFFGTPISEEYDSGGTVPPPDRQTSSDSGISDHSVKTDTTSLFNETCEGGQTIGKEQQGKTDKEVIPIKYDHQSNNQDDDETMFSEEEFSVCTQDIGIDIPTGSETPMCDRCIYSGAINFHQRRTKPSGKNVDSTFTRAHTGQIVQPCVSKIEDICLPKTVRDGLIFVPECLGGEYVKLKENTNGKRYDKTLSNNQKTVDTSSKDSHVSDENWGSISSSAEASICQDYARIHFRTSSFTEKHLPHPSSSPTLT